MMRTQILNTTNLNKNCPLLNPTLILVLLISFISFTIARISELETDCRDLPHSDFLTAQELDSACSHRRMWLHDRDSKGPSRIEDRLTAKQLAYIKSLARDSDGTEELSIFPTGTSFFSKVVVVTTTIV